MLPIGDVVSMIFVFLVINQYGINGQIRKLQKSSFIPPVHATHVLELDLGVTQCTNGLRCIHGYCTRRTKEILIWECVCDPGWVGLVCDQRVDRHDLPVDIPVRVPTSDKLPESSRNDNGNTILDNGSKQSDGGTAESSLELADGRHACDKSYIPRTFTERTCTLGLLCRFGTCFVDHQDTYIAYTCHCDEGAVGIFCEHKCCLACGARGSCQLLPNGTQFCNCDIGYQGSECQERQTHNLAYGTTQEHKISKLIYLFIYFVNLSFR